MGLWKLGLQKLANGFGLAIRIYRLALQPGPHFQNFSNDEFCFGYERLCPVQMPRRHRPSLCLMNWTRLSTSGARPTRWHRCMRCSSRKTPARFATNIWSCRWPATPSSGFSPPMISSASRHRSSTGCWCWISTCPRKARCGRCRPRFIAMLQAPMANGSRKALAPAITDRLSGISPRQVKRILG